MSSDDLNERLRATFMQELEEQVRELNSSLLAHEQNPGDAELIRSLFRAAHTIKGAARVAGFPVVEGVCHAMESVFAALRERGETLSGADYSLLFATCDALQDAARRLRAGDTLAGSAAEALLPQLDAMAARTGEAERPGTRAVPAAKRRTAAPPAAPAQDRRAVPEPPEQRPSPDAEAPEQQSRTPAEADADELVRVSAERLDVLMSAVGELIIATGRIVERSGREDDAARRLDAATDQVADVVRRLRLRPFGDVCEGLPRAVRDVAAAGGKEVSLTIEGTDAEADRMVIDALRDPLLHLVRNAVDHGIESPDARERVGKPRRGAVRVTADLRGGRLVAEVSDDGAGLDEASIRSTLRERGQPEPESSAEVAEALLAGGFSTRAVATEISGRGVGLDIVRSSLDRIGGTVDVEWKEGRGTTFILECPPTPATLRAVLVRLGSYLYAIPTTHVERLRRTPAASLRNASGGTVLPTSRGPVRVLSLARLLGPPLEARSLAEHVLLAIVSAGSRRAALIVDEFIDEDEIVLRPLEAADGAVPHAAGAAILPSGKVAMVLAVPSLLVAGLRPGTAIAPPQAEQSGQRRQRVLVADDSITTRTLEQSVLESAGYEVLTAVNGEDAWNILDAEGADALVADVEMPRMDGFALCRRVRASKRFRELPIVLVTGLESAGDRARGLEAGADAYIAKSGFDQATLLDTVRQLIT